MKNFIIRCVLLMMISILLILPLKLRSNIVWFMADLKHKMFGSSIFDEYEEENA